MTKKYILSIDQGTTSSRAVLFDESGNIIQIAQEELQRHFPKEGYVEQKPQDIIDGTLRVVKKILDEHKDDEIVSCGITNQRETVICWDKTSGKAVYNAIVWQDRRTDDWCKSHKDQYDKNLKEKTGLLLDAYFSASKIKWILDNVAEAKNLLEQGKLICGTVDSFLLWHLTNGKEHATDTSNASRTLLYNIQTGGWDKELLDFFGVPQEILPEVRDSCSDFGNIAQDLIGRAIPIRAMIGDQQAATVGQGCLKPSTGKITFGTGCFMMLNTGDKIVTSKSGLLSTVLYSIDGKITYGLEGVCFYAGAVVQWLRDSLELIATADETEELARQAQDVKDLYFVPALNGLAAPHWNPQAKGLIKGITNQVGKKEIVKAALDAIILQAYDLMISMEEDAEFSVIRVDGGMINNNWFTDRLANILQKTIHIPKNTESTAFGAALLAGVGAGVFGFDDIEGLCNIKEKKVADDLKNRNQIIEGWNEAVKLAQN